MARTPLQRKADLKAAVTLKEMTLAEAAAHLGVSYNHLMLVVAGERVASAALKKRLAAFLNIPVSELFDPTMAR